MFSQLMEFAQGKIVMALEGGYNLDSIAKSSLACVQVLLEDEPIQGSSEAYPFESTWRVIQAVRLYIILSSNFPISQSEIILFELALISLSSSVFCHKYSVALMLLVDKAHLFLVGLGTQETMHILAFTCR